MREALPMLKALSDDARLKIVRALHERDMYVELLAERLQLSSATISFHIKKLLAAGILDVRKEQYYSVYSLRREAFSMTLDNLLFGDGTQDAEAKQREEMYRRKVIKSFMPNGYCERLPVQQKKRQIIYEEIYRLFEPNREYPEKEVNEIIGRIHGDFCSVRRAFVSAGWMTRGGGIYRLVGDGKTPPLFERSGDEYF